MTVSRPLYFVIVSLACSGCIEILPVPGETPEVRCGDGTTNAGEECDDGNLSDRDGCTNLCILAVCNDGIQRLDLAEDHPDFEICDDGNSNENDDCTTLCAPPACHDGIKQNWEACDDGNTVDTDACVGECVVSACGDGFVQETIEQCDPQAPDALENCDDSCRLQACGNGLIEGGEACDDGNSEDADACRNSCVVARCGDGIARTDIAEGVEGFEACDGEDRPDDALWCSVECLIDDHGNAPETATPIAEGGTLSANLAPGDEDWFAVVAPVAGLYRFIVLTDPPPDDPNDAPPENNPEAPDTHCETRNNEGAVGASVAYDRPGFDYRGCRVYLNTPAGETAYLRLTHAPEQAARNFSVHLQPVCGNELRDEGEECDPTESITARFDCRSDCRLRRRSAVSRYNICDLHEGGVRCWGSNEYLLLGSLEGLEPGEDGY